ncbi:LytR family transcriptional regulator [Nocardia asteroides NBRC 15531]|uniref:Putative LytR family regulatory protein n=1 Tax=Nocardia asteroides NBRC 15531 TaxID=1110697 RepID=U5E9B4_NOCAS|nr:LCP family protein [Nocardia asteroides]TLF70159.1 LytR family transcriptional regulator [Nocardia asteroides NBRC 15531]UGT49690.1 LCP family protein [Nocardia asteroides]SFL98443.1 transcriptional attenuator, LytR family [Nocardia asteroides]VEG37597.1 Regulatory protein msrR [Nocardia asteroides]BAO98848.1 putative LytR family regulatory protein [Nocardia asteroides NBRC 15531]
MAAQTGALGPAKVMVAISAVLVLALTGFAWRSVDNLIANIDRIGGLGLGGGRDGAVDILLVGVDSRTDAHGNPLTSAERAMLHAGDEVGTNTDTIVLVRVPNDGSSATAISIPRDSYVDIPGQGKGKINSAYGSTKETERAKLLDKGSSEGDAERESTKAGRQALIKSVASLTGITVDHYAEVSLLGFVLLTDAVGGVEVCLNNAVDEWMSGAEFPAGEQRLDGQQALSFVRQRHGLPRGDIDRIVRQQVFMAQLVGQLLNAKVLANPGKLNEISEAVGRTVVLDEDWDVLAFLQQLKDLSGGKVEFETIPVADLNSMTSAGESVVRVEPKAVQDYVAGLVGEEKSGGDDKPKVDPSTVAVSVFNAGGKAGLAAKVSAALTGKGFREGLVGNYTGGSVSSSRVLAADESDPKAAAVAEALGGLTVVADPSLSADTVSVVLASDYSGPGSAAAGMFDFDGTSSATATPVPPAPPIDAGQNGPKCVN